MAGPATSPRSSKKSLDDLTDEEELMDFEESSRPSTGEGRNTREPSISEDSRDSSRASSVSRKDSGIMFWYLEDTSGVNLF